jgi:hypothetical protein
MLKTLTPWLAAASILGGLVGTIVLKNAEEAGLRKTIAGWDACAAEVETGRRVGDASACPAPIAFADLTARRTARCDTGLGRADAFAVDAACSAPVKTVVAERDARTRERDGLQLQLTDLRQRQAAAISAAEARGRNQTQRTERVETDLSAAPRTDAGLGRCDAECLRNLGRAPAAH